MSDGFVYDTSVQPDWIDYNGHMQDAYYGLVFSYAVDKVWDAIGIDRAYRDATSCTMYLVEDHKYFLSEVKEAAPLRVETLVLDHTDKMIHLHLSMISAGKISAVCEFMELHVKQTPKPHGAPMPDDVLDHLAARKVQDAQAVSALTHRSRALKIGRR